MGKADATTIGPIEHGRHQGPTLRHEREAAGRHLGVGKTGVESCMGRQQAQAVGPQDAQQVLARRIQHGLLLCLGKPGGQHNGGAGALGAERLDDAGHGVGRRAHDRKLGHTRQILDTRIDRLAVQVAMFGVDRPARPGKRGGAHIAPHRSAHAGGARTGADHRDGMGIKKRVEMPDAHGEPLTDACDMRASHHPVGPAANARSLAQGTQSASCLQRHRDGPASPQATKLAAPETARGVRARCGAASDPVRASP